MELVMSKSKYVLLGAVCLLMILPFTGAKAGTKPWECRLENKSAIWWNHEQCDKANVGTKAVSKERNVESKPPKEPDTPDDPKDPPKDDDDDHCGPKDDHDNHHEHEHEHDNHHEHEDHDNHHEDHGPKH
jgi:hypothetical protein